MQKILKRFLTFTLALVMCLGITATVHTAVTDYVVAEAATSDTYYSGITATGGTQLLGQLHDLITSSRTKYSSYDNCRDFGTTTDPGKGSNTVMEFYTQKDISASKWDVNGGWNREHVWPKADSNGLWKSNTVGGGADLHHIRPAEKDLNAKRGNLKYGEVGNGSSVYFYGTDYVGGYSSGGTFEPMDNVKGDVARILMYVYTHYNKYSNAIFGGFAKTNGSKGESSYFGTLNFTHIITASNEDAAIKLLLEWNESDPVDQIERNRNEAVYKIQGNRNPFIDNESYAEAIWGNGSAVGPGPVTPPTPSGTLKAIYLNASSVTMYTGQTYTFSITTDPSTASKNVHWSSSDTSVATISGGTVTAKSAGTTTITATSTSNSAIKATATVTVKQSASSGTSSGKFTITSDSFSGFGYSYDYYDWSTNDGSINGFAYVGNETDGSFRFSTRQKNSYLANTTPTPSPIKSVTIKLQSGYGQKDFKLLTSTTPYEQLAIGNPSNGKDHGTQKITDSYTWTCDGNDTCFALVYAYTGTSTAYVESIEVEYVTTGGGTVDPPPVVSGGGNVQVFRAAVASINSTGTLSTWRLTLNSAVAVYKTLTAAEKTEAAADVETLKSAIASYNEKIRLYNSADEAALKGAGIFL